VNSGASDLSTEARRAKVDVLERLAHRFPSLLVDAVAEHEPGKRLVAFKNVTVNEEFFQGHFPHKPLMPAVLMIEALTQAATLLLLDEAGNRAGVDVHLRGVDGAKFRKHVTPGDQLKLIVTIGAVFLFPPAILAFPSTSPSMAPLALIVSTTRVSFSQWPTESPV